MVLFVDEHNNHLSSLPGLTRQSRAGVSVFAALDPRVKPEDDELDELFGPCHDELPKREYIRIGLHHD